MVDMRNADFRLPLGPGALAVCCPTWVAHSAPYGECAEQSGAMSARNAGSQGFPPSTAESRLGESSLVTAPYVRGGASLLAKTGRSEQGGD